MSQISVVNGIRMQFISQLMLKTVFEIEFIMLCSFCSCVVKWLDLQKERLSLNTATTSDDIDSHMEQLVIEVMSHVRFPMMSPRQLADLLLSPLTKTYKEFFVERMAIGMAFHSGTLQV
jgi:hypothetical protein